MMRALHLSDIGLTEPLGRAQVVPYLRGLARSGWTIEAVGCEPAGRGEAPALADELAADGIAYHWIEAARAEGQPPEHRDRASWTGLAAERALSFVPNILHARNRDAALVAIGLRPLIPSARVLLDLRNLLYREAVERGEVVRKSLRHGLLRSLEKQALRCADAVVLLTDWIHDWLRERGWLSARSLVEVIPCCVDVERFRPDPWLREAARRELGAADRFVLAYSGSLGIDYCLPEMARFYAAVRQIRPSLLLVVSQSPTGELQAALREAGVPAEEAVLRRAPAEDVPRLLQAADAAVSFVRPTLSKRASSPTKNGEYLALGLPVAMNRGVGDSDRLIDEVSAVIDAGGLGGPELERAAHLLVSIDVDRAREAARRAAVSHLGLDTVGIPRYLSLYRDLACGWT